MIGYVTHHYSGSHELFEHIKEIVAEIQEDDWDNCYVCPVLAFPYICGCDDDVKNVMSVRLDLLSVCDQLIVVGKTIDTFMQAEIDFARLVGMEIFYV